MNSSYVQFGCGLCAPAGWRNFDASPTLWLQKYVPFMKSFLLHKGCPEFPAQIEYADVIKGLPVPQNSATAIYCSHVLEHLALSEFHRSIRNVYAYLKPGGTFRLVVPDLEYLIRQYIANPAPDAASTLLQSSFLGEVSKIRGLRSLPILLFNRSKHLWMWDYKNIANELSNAGFFGIRRASYNDSADLRFREVEDPVRWENCVGVECRKPFTQ